MACGKAAAENLVRGRAKDACILPNAIDLAHFSPDAGKKEALGLSGRVLLFVGRFANQKNLFFLLDAFAGALKREAMTLVLVGGGEQERALRGRAEALEFVVKSGSRNLEIPFRDIRFKKNVLVAAIVRGGRLIIPTGTDCIRVNDSVIVVTSSSNVINDLNDVFEAQAGRNER